MLVQLSITAAFNRCVLQHCIAARIAPQKERMGRDKPPPPSKADKKKKGKGKEPVAKRCECERRCECGLRPERPTKKDGRPDHGFRWDGDQQKWVGKGSRDQRIASKLTDKGPKEVKGLIVKTHEKLPSQMLGEWCQREKRPKPRWHPAKPAPPGKHRSRCIVPDPKRRGSEHDLAFCPAEAFPSESIAKENAALLALKQTQGSLPLERKLPEPYRSTWLAMGAGLCGNHSVDLREPPCHRADAATGTTSRRRRGAPEI